MEDNYETFGHSPPIPIPIPSLRIDADDDASLMDTLSLVGLNSPAEFMRCSNHNRHPKEQRTANNDIPNLRETAAPTRYKPLEAL